jgi:PqqD family protein of HPr-rel-A system
MADPRFIAPKPDCLIISPLDAVVALYHRPSAMTHLVVEPVPEIIEALQSGPLSVADLLAKLALPRDSDTVDAVTARLNELEAGGLIARQ